MQNKKIAFTGPFSDINFGDYAMLVNNIYDLSVQNNLLFSYDDEFLKKISEKYLNDFNIDIQDVHLDIPKHYKEYINELTPFIIKKYTRNIDIIIEKLYEVDVLIVNGGGYFNDLWSQQHRINKLLKIVLPIILASELGVPIHFTGNSFGPYDYNLEFFKNIFTYINTNNIKIRDRLESQNQIKSLGVEINEKSFIPDDLMFINYKLKEFPLPNKLKNFALENRYIVLETYLPVDYLKVNEMNFYNFFKCMNDNFNLKVVLMPFHLSQGGMNQAQYLKSIYNDSLLINIDQYGYLPIEQANFLINNASMVISNRYHALILALQNETPFYTVLKNVLNSNAYYFTKNFGAIQEIINTKKISQNLFMGTSLIESLDYLTIYLNESINYQLQSYSSTYSEENILNLQTIRKKLITDIKSNLNRGNNDV